MSTPYTTAPTINQGTPALRSAGNSSRTVPNWTSLPEPQRRVVTALPVDFEKVGNGITPLYWWNSGHGETVEAGLVGPGSGISPVITLAPLGQPSGVTTNLPGIHTLGLYGLRRRTPMTALSPPILPDHDPPDGKSLPPPCPEISSSLQLETPVLRGAANRQLPSQSNQTKLVPQQDSQLANARSESRKNSRRSGIARTKRGEALIITQVHYDPSGRRSFWRLGP